MDWFRWHHGSVTDPKFRLVAKRAQASVAEVVAVWAFVLETASQNPERGAFGEIDTEALDLALGMDDGTTDRILSAMHDRALIADGRIPAWDKRQPKREDNTAAERQRLKRQREQELALAQAAAVTGVTSRDVTQCHAASRAVTPEEKREEEIDQKQEQKRKGRSAPLELPDWLPADAWDAWHRFRNGRRGWTPDARALSLRTLTTLRSQGHDPRAVIEQSIERGWTGLFPLKNDAAPRGSPQAQPSKQVQALKNILGIPHENDDTARVVLDCNPAGIGADVRQLPSGLPFV